MIWLQLPDIERMKILNAVGGITQLSTAAIEKDWWVAVVPDACFRTPWAGQLAFKGGTSLIMTGVSHGRVGAMMMVFHAVSVTFLCGIFFGYFFL
jgi:hypothetical protein